MRIQGKEYRTIWYENSVVKIIDQTKLPHNFIIKDLETVDHAVNAIRSMEVRGAPLIGATAAYGLVLAILENNDFETVESNHDDLIMLMYTSGTTGHPKGAMINHQMQFFNTVNLGATARITDKTIQLVVLPLFHTGGMNCYANPILHNGGQIVLMKEFDPGKALESINSPDFGVTHFFAVPAPFQFMMQHPNLRQQIFQELKEPV